MIDASTARRFWNERESRRRRVRFIGEEQWRTVVGVVADVQAYRLSHTIPEYMKGTVYVPYRAAWTQEEVGVPADMTLVARTAFDTSQFEAFVRRALPTGAQEVVVSAVRPMQSVIDDAVATPAATTSLLASMAALALVLGCIGVYGVLSFLVSRQTRDLGIRFRARRSATRRVLAGAQGRRDALCSPGLRSASSPPCPQPAGSPANCTASDHSNPTTYVAVVDGMCVVTFAPATSDASRHARRSTDGAARSVNGGYDSSMTVG